LARTDKKYKKNTDAILKASTKEILTMGAIGHHAEVSSAGKLRSEGSPVQAWSAALYCELAETLSNI